MDRSTDPLSSGGAGAVFMMATLITIFSIIGFFFNRCANQFGCRSTGTGAGVGAASSEPPPPAEVGTGQGGGGRVPFYMLWGTLQGGRLLDSAIASLPLTKLAAAAECAVCLGDVAAGEVARLLPLCGHTFHMECVDTWLRSHATCPLCRQTAIDVNEMLLAEMPPQPRNNVQDAQPTAQAQGPILLPPAVLPQADGRAPLAQARDGGQGNGQQSHSLQVFD